MYCPECGAEYREGFWCCADCGVGLVHEPPPSRTRAPDPDLILVPVFESTHPLQIALAKSILESNDVDVAIRGGTVPDMLVWGFVSRGAGALSTPAVFLARPADADRARALLRDLVEVAREEAAAPDDPPSEPAPDEGPIDPGRWDPPDRDGD